MPIDYSTYHPKWKRISFFIRFYRAKGKCEWCGIKHKAPSPVSGKPVVLSTAHLDHNKNNNSFFNLAALCQRCHLRHDRHQHAENRKYGRNWKDNQLKLDLK